VVCFRNAGAYTVFGIAWMVVLMGLGLVVTLLAGLLASPEAAATLIMPVALLMAAMFSTSIYFTFEGSFEASATDDPIPPGETP
jgi:hypothetical protein